MDGVGNPAACLELSAVKSFISSSFSVLRAIKKIRKLNKLKQSRNKLKIAQVLTKAKIGDLVLKHDQELR